jgi:hypothetical protein
MPLCALLRMGRSNAERDLWRFEHTMAHRFLFGSLSPLSQFSVLPYNLDPSQFNGKWTLLNHQKSHWDATATLTTFPWWWFQGVTPAPSEVPAGGLGEAMNGNMVDTDLNNQRTFPWWLHENHTQHLNAMDLLAKEATYPFW